MAIDSDGNYMMRMSNNMVMDMDSGDIHMISSWEKDSEDEDDKRHNLFNDEED